MDIRQTIGGYSIADRDALASMIYGEARNQNLRGKAAVGYTALTRAGIAGVSVSDVVYGSTSKNYGQYSFANPKDPNAKTVANAPEKDPDGWADAQAVADGIMNGEIENPVPGATHYKTKAVKPGWAKKQYALGKVGSHDFYALPEAEVASVVSNAAASRYRREPLVETGAEEVTPESDIDINDLDVGSYRGLPSVDGDPQMVSTGEFNFSGKNSLPGFGRMTPRTKQLASDIARTLPTDQDMTITATHGSHGLTNKTHTPGEAFDVRTRDLSQPQMDELVTSTLYAQPASIGINSGAGRFPQHMHVDMNAGYGTGLQSHSDFAGLSDFAKSELERYDEAMKAGEGYSPPVPEAIAPVPEARPEQFGISDAIADAGVGLEAEAGMEIGDGGQQVAAADPVLSAGLSGEVGATLGNIPTQTSDGVPIRSVKSISITPDNPLSGPSTADAMPTGSADVGAEVSSIGDIDVPSIDAQPDARPIEASAIGSSGVGTSGEAETVSDVSSPIDASPSLDAGVGAGDSAVGSMSLSETPASIPSEASATGGVGTYGEAAGTLDATPQIDATASGYVGFSPKASADIYMDAPVSTPQTIGATPEASIGMTPAAAAETSIDLGASSLAADVADQRAIDEAKAQSIGDAATELAETEIAEEAPASIGFQPVEEVPSLGQRRNIARRDKQEVGERSSLSAPASRASDVWNGESAIGQATDGSTVYRNPDGSVSRYSQKYGHTEIVSPSVQGWSGPSVEGFRTNDRQDMGFWGSLKDSLKTLSGRKTVADVSMETRREEAAKGVKSSIDDAAEEAQSQTDQAKQQAEDPTQDSTDSGDDASSKSSIGGTISDFFSGIFSDSDGGSQLDRARNDIADGKTTGLY